MLATRLSSEPMRRAAAAVFAAVALGACGAESQEARSPLDDALGYVPRDAPAVVAVETGGPQTAKAGELLGRMPVVGGRVHSEFENWISWAFLRFERDIRPLLGHELVVAVTSPRDALAADGFFDSLSSLVVAWRVADPRLAKRVIIRSPDLQAHGKVNGVRLWQNQRGKGWLAIDGDVFVATGSREQLERALERRRADGRMSEAQFDEALEGLPDDALVRAKADPRALLEDFPRLRGALAQRWIASLRYAGVALSARDDGFALALRARTAAGELSDDDLPLAPSGPTPAALRQGSETGVGLSEPGRLARFAEQVLRSVDPARYALLDRARRRLRERAGVDIQRDLLARIQQGSLAVSLDGTDIAARALVVEAGKFRQALDDAIPALPGLGSAFGVRDLGVASPAPGQRFYAAAVPGHQSIVFGLVGNSLVASDDTARAGELVIEPSRIVEGARGAAVLSADAGAIVERWARRSVRGLERIGLGIALRPLGDLTAWLAISREELRGQAQLHIDG